MRSLTVLLQFISFFFSLSSSQPSFNSDTYLEVYPDPTDPEVLKGRTPLYFALIQSLGGPSSQFDGSGSIAGVKVALERINNDTTLLPGYTLHYTLTDSKVLCYDISYIQRSYLLFVSLFEICIYLTLIMLCSEVAS